MGRRKDSMVVGRIRQSSRAAARVIAAGLLASSTLVAAVPASATTTTTATSAGPVLTPPCSHGPTDSDTNAFWTSLANAWFFAFGKTIECGGPPSITDLRRIDLFGRVNAERVGRGLSPLQWDPNLSAYAANWSANMAAHGFRHGDISVLTNSYGFVGENIAMGSRGVSVGMLHGALMNSDVHRSNMLDPRFTNLGIGVYCASDGSLWLTEDFGRPPSAGPSGPPPSGTPPPTPVMRSDAGTDEC